MHQSWIQARNMVKVYIYLNCTCSMHLFYELYCMLIKRQWITCVLVGLLRKLKVVVQVEASNVTIKSFRGEILTL